MNLSLKCYLTLQTSTPQNGQTHSNNSSAKADKLFECVWSFCVVGALSVEPLLSYCVTGSVQLPSQVQCLNSPLHGFEYIHNRKLDGLSKVLGKFNCTWNIMRKDKLFETWDIEQLLACLVSFFAKYVSQLLCCLAEL